MIDSGLDMTVAVYLRTTTKSQTTDLQYQAAAKLLPGVPLKKYEDLGFSGKKTLNERPDLQRLIRDITAGKVTRLMVFSRGRITRDPCEWIHFWEICKAHNVSIEFSNGNEPAMNDNISIEAVLAFIGYERHLKMGQRIRWAKQAAQESKAKEFNSQDQ